VVPSIGAPPGASAPDVITSIPDVMQALLAALIVAALVEVSKFTWLAAIRTRALDRRLAAAGYLALLGLQLALLRDTLRYYHFDGWSWLLWQLSAGDLPAGLLRSSKVAAFLPSGTMLVICVALAVFAVRARSPMANAITSHE
jgi:hypothetical protein